MTCLHWKSARLAAVIHPYLGNGICVGTALAGQKFQWPASFEAGHFLLPTARRFLKTKAENVPQSINSCAIVVLRTNSG